MKNGVCLVFTFFILSVTGIVGQNVDTDKQIWGITTFEFPLDGGHKKLSGELSGELRVTDNISDLTDLRFGFGVEYKAKKNVTIKPSYVFRIQRISNRANRYEHRLRFDLTPKKEFKNLSLENRNRLEHRIKHIGRNDDTFYRNRTRLRVPLRKNGRTIVTPFVSDDIWFDLQNAMIFRNDLSGGLSRKVTDNFSADFFYRHRQNFRPGTKDEKIFGIKIYFWIKKQ
jgi:hypothetical protein